MVVASIIVDDDDVPGKEKIELKYDFSLLVRDDEERVRLIDWEKCRLISKQVRWRIMEMMDLIRVSLVFKSQNATKSSINIRR